MKRVLLFSIWISIYSVGIASNQDSLKVQQYLNQAIKLYNADIHFDSIMYLLEEASLLAYKNGIWEPYIYCLLSSGNISGRLQDYDGMRCFAFKAHEEANSLLKPEHPYRSIVLNNLGGYYSFIGENEKAIDLTKKSIELLLHSEPDLESIDDSYDQQIITLLNLGDYLSLIGDVPKAISYYNQAILLSKDSLQTRPFLAARVTYGYYSIALESYATHKFEEAVNSYKKNIEFIKVSDREDLYAFLENHISLANALRALQRWEECKFHLDKASYYLKLYRKKVGSGSKEENYHNIKAKYFADIGRFKESIIESDSAIHISKVSNKIQKKTVLNGNLIITKGETYIKQKNWQMALHQFQEALIEFSNSDFNEKDVYYTSSEQDFEILSEHIFEALSLKVYSFHELYKESKERRDLTSAYQSSQLLIQLADRYRQQLQTQGSQLFISTKLKPTYEKAIEISLELYELTKEERYLEEAFKISEKSKAALLSNSLTTTKAKYTGGVPDSVVSQERELLANISFYKNQVFKENNKVAGPIEARINQWERKIFELEREKDAFDEVLKKNYPLYFQHKHQTEEISVTEIQKELDSKTQLIEYFAGDSSLYVFTITKTEIRYKKIEKPAALYEKIHSFTQQLADVDKQTQPIHTFKKEGHFLYKELVGEGRGTDVKLIIIPDGILGRLPFESLLTEASEKKNFTRLSFLLSKHEVQYGYSALLLFKDPLKRTYKQAEKLWAGFAPSFTDEKRLQYNQDEVEQINAQMKGVSYKSQSADLQTFLSQAANYRILHLATHGYADVENPQFSKLEFTYQDSLNDGILYAHELANHKLNAELVVLSACETGHGSIAKGEGIMSLAWSFRYAGVPSIVMSLWKAESNVSKQLMSYFYTHLNAGKSKSKSLQLAKLDYLANPIPGKEHPRNWANFVVIGDDAPVSRGFNWWWVIGVMGILILVGLYGMHRRERI